MPIRRSDGIEGLGVDDVDGAVVVAGDKFGADGRSRDSRALSSLSSLSLEESSLLLDESESPMALNPLLPEETGAVAGAATGGSGGGVAEEEATWTPPLPWLVWPPTPEDTGKDTPWLWPPPPI
jgi:hypothetical protein